MVALEADPEPAASVVALEADPEPAAHFAPLPVVSCHSRALERTVRDIADTFQYEGDESSVGDAASSVGCVMLTGPRLRLHDPTALRICQEVLSMGNYLYSDTLMGKQYGVSAKRMISLRRRLHAALYFIDQHRCLK